MFNKVMFTALGLTAALTAPIAIHSVSQSWKSGGTQKPSAAAAAATGTAAAVNPAVEGTLPTAPPATASAGDLTSLPVRRVDQVFRFDATPEWIVRSWPRVSTGLAQMQLQGYRVPLVTGTTEADLAGSLTYYFNAQQQVQQIAFHGATGDVRNLLGMLSDRYHLVRRLTNDPGLTVYESVRSDGSPASSVRIRSAPIIKANEPRQRYEVQLVLERPEE